MILYMPQVNIISLGYLFVRLAPFIVVCYFVLQSMFNQDYKGVFYIAGLLIACLNQIAIQPILEHLLGTPSTLAGKPAVCTAIDGMPDAPIGQSILGFTLGYLSFIIGKSNMAEQNVPTFIFFPVMIILDFAWNMYNQCFNSKILLATHLAGLLIGIIWGLIIWNVDKDLAIYNGISNKDICKMASKTTFKCRPKTA